MGDAGSENFDDENRNEKGKWMEDYVKWEVYRSEPAIEMERVF
jgi:hypothetical protein